MTRFEPRRTPQPPSAAPRTLLEGISRHGRQEAVSRGIRLLDERGRPSFLAYSELLLEAAAAGRALDRAGLRRKDRVLILLPLCRTLITTIVGCTLRGLVAFPGEPGAAWSRREEAPQETLALARRAGVRAIVTAARRTATLVRQLGPGDPLVLASESLRHAPAIGLEDAPSRVLPEDAALIVTAPGTGGARRPVLLTQGNLAAHLNALGRALRTGEREILCGFAGLDNVAGLVDQLFFGLFFGFDQVLLAPDRVYSQPGSWIRAISDYRCTLTLAEDAAYGLAAHRMEVEEPGQPIDLSCLRRAVALGSTVRPGTQEAFLRRFTPLGLSPYVFLPAYGLPEASGILTMGRPGGHPLNDRFDRRSLRPGEYVHTAGRADSRGRLMMSSGMPLAGLELRITGLQGELLEEGRVGSIGVRGTGVSPGIDGREGPDEQGWLDTGDIGFIMEGELFVIGRRGEGLDLNGLCYHPEELEVLAGEVPGIRQGGVAAFTVDEEDGEKPVVVAASDRGLGQKQRGVLAERLGVRIGRMIGVRPQVVLVPAGSLPRRARGPAHREDCRERYLESWSEEGGPPRCALAGEESAPAEASPPARQAGRARES